MLPLNQINILDFILPESEKNEEAACFEDRFHLKKPEPLIRIRILDGDYKISGLTDISLSPKDLQSLNLFKRGADIGIIIENLLNFLTFPKIKKGFCIWGKGKALSLLKTINWLSGISLYYWGDIDIEGFKMVDQLRHIFPHVRTFLMNKKTYEDHVGFAVKTKEQQPVDLIHLNDDENEMYRHLLVTPERNRLEQERISQTYLEQELLKLNLANGSKY